MLEKKIIWAFVGNGQKLHACQAIIETIGRHGYAYCGIGGRIKMPLDASDHKKCKTCLKSCPELG